MRGIKTLAEMEELYYGRGSDYIMKTDAPVISTTTGVYNAVYGAQVWSALNQEANAFGIMPKNPWTRSGWRVITARAASSDAGLAENATLPDTIKPTFAELSTKPKTVGQTFDVSEVQNFLASESEDDAIGGMEFLRAHMAVHHREMLNIQLLADVDTTITNQFESIDRVVSSKAEEDNCLDAGDADIYSLDRSDSTYSYADAYVNHNNDTDHTLADSYVRTALYQAHRRGGNPQFWLTGEDTVSALQALYHDQTRYNVLGQTKAKISQSGIETSEGFDVGLVVSKLYGYPVFTSKNVVQDTLSRIYLLDTSDPEGFGVPRLGIDIAKPTQYFEGGIDAPNKDVFAVNRLGTEGLFRTMGELKCRFFYGQAKIRDLQ